MTERTRTLGGRYELGELLGSGGMARVYRGTDRVLGRQVAVKLLHAHFGEDPEYVARFRREARTAAALNHPNVVAVYDTGEDDDARFIIMEYVEGRTLDDLLRDEGPITEARAATIAADVCRGLHAAHQKGLVHRDIKPANIMLTADGQVKVMDFGIARALSADTVTRTAIVVGTAAYLSPEQARGERVDHRSDLYSLGVVVYQMLAGTPPFTGENALAVATKHLNEPPPPLQTGAADVPSAIEGAVMRALEKDPDQRFADASEMGAALAATVETPAAAATTPAGDTAVLDEAPTEVVPRGRRRSPIPWLLALAAAALVGLLVFLAIATNDPLTPPRRAQQQEAPAATQPPEEAPAEEESPAPEPPPTLSPEEAFAILVASIEDGHGAGELTDKAHEELMKKADEAFEKYQEADLEAAVVKIGDLREETAKLLEDEEISSPDRAAKITEAAGAFEQSILAASASSSQDTENETDAPGNSEGKGEKKGHEKDD